MSRDQRGAKAAIVLTAFLDVTGFTVVSPILPLFQDKFGASLLQVSMLAGAYAAVGLVAGPVAGALSDRLGRKKTLMYSVLVAAVGWLIMAAAPSFWVLFLGRMVCGAAFGNFAIVQSMLGDLGKDAKERTMNLSLFSMAVGVSYMVGPALGGWLAEWSPSAPLWLSMGLSLANALAVRAFVPETAPAAAGKPRRGVLASIADTVTDRRLRPGLALWLVMMMGYASYQGVLPLILEDAYGFGPAAVGNVLALLGGVILVNQGLLMRHVWLKMEGRTAAWTTLAGAGLVAAAVPLMDGRWVVLAALPLLGIFQGVFRPVVNNLLMEAAPGAKRGEVNGVASSAMTLAMAICPALSGIMLETGTSPFALTSAFFLASLLFLRPTLAAAKAARPDGRLAEVPVGLIE